MVAVSMGVALCTGGAVHGAFKLGWGFPSPFCPALPGRGAVAPITLPATSAKVLPGGFVLSLERGYKICCTKPRTGCCQLQRAQCPFPSPEAGPGFVTPWGVHPFF